MPSDKLTTWIRPRRVLVVPLLACAIGVIGFLVLYDALKVREEHFIESLVREKSLTIERRFYSQTNSRLMAIQRMARRWEKVGGTPLEQWQDDADNFTEQQNGSIAVAWADTESRIRWIAPRAGNEAVIGMNMRSDGAHNKPAQRISEESATVLTPPADFVQGYKGFIAYIPLRVNGRSAGYMAGIFNSKKYFNELLATEEANQFAISLSYGGREFFRNAESDLPLVNALAVERTILIHGENWLLRIVPTEHMVAKHHSPLPGIVMGAGCLITFLLWVTAHHVLLARINMRRLKNNKKRLRLLVEKLAESNKELERFAYVASHDMQEPMRMISGFSQLLRENYRDTLDEEAKEYLGFINDASMRMREMIVSLLDYARIGNEPVRNERIDTGHEMHNVRGHLANQIGQCDAVVTNDTLPIIRGNAMQFMRLLLNLVGNALKYADPGRTPRVHIGVEEEGDYWKFHVRDNGLGIPEEFALQIFEPFRRLHGWDAIKGAGIGLSICRTIVENHGGSIWVVPAPDHGSIFYFTIRKMPLSAD